MAKYINADELIERKYIPSFEGKYEVDKTGRVFNSKTGQVCAMAGLTSDQIAAILNLVLAVSKYHTTNMLEIMRECAEEIGGGE